MKGISTTGDTAINANTISDNFAFLEVYYSDLNYEILTENAAYEVSCSGDGLIE